MPTTAANLGLVQSAMNLVRAALETSDMKPLRDFVARAQEWSADVDDVFAAAGQAVVDGFGDVPRAQLHDVIRRVAAIERDVLAPAYRDGRDTFRTVYAG